MFVVHDSCHCQHKHCSNINAHCLVHGTCAGDDTPQWQHDEATADGMYAYKPPWRNSPWQYMYQQFSGNIAISLASSCAQLRSLHLPTVWWCPTLRSRPSAKYSIAMPCCKAWHCRAFPKRYCGCGHRPHPAQPNATLE
jgi:hypothetical protein